MDQRASRALDGTLNDTLYLLFEEDIMEEALRIFELHDRYHDKACDEAELEEFGKRIRAFVKTHHYKLPRMGRDELELDTLTSELFYVLAKARRAPKAQTESAAQGWLVLTLQRICYATLRRQPQKLNPLLSVQDHEQLADEGPSPLEQVELKVAAAKAAQLEHAVALIREHFIPRIGRKDMREAAPKRFEQQLMRTFKELSADDILQLSDDLDSKTRQTEHNKLNKHLERLRTRLWSIYQEERRAREQRSGDVMPITDDELELIGHILDMFTS